MSGAGDRVAPNIGSGSTLQGVKPVVANSKIEWTDHTFSPWLGCEKISPACTNCYAESWAKRTGHPELWQGQRRRTSVANWRNPIKWNAAAKEAGRRDRVFCASLADVFDNQVPAEWRADLWNLIHATPHLDWLLLTKRIGNVKSMIPWYSYRGSVTPTYWSPNNVWIGATVANQEEAERDIPKLLEIQAKVRFLSCEPLLGPIKLWWLDEDKCALRGPGVVVSGGRTASTPHDPPEGYDDSYPGIDWVIVGGESGPNARSMTLGWAKEIVRDCKAVGVPVFMKQLGSKPVNREGVLHPINDRKGALVALDWPESLRVREFPEAR
jgi:protein gp37